MAWNRWTAVLRGSDDEGGTSGAVLATWGIIAPTRKHLPEGATKEGVGGYSRDVGLMRTGIVLRSYPFTFDAGDHDTGTLEQVAAVLRKPYKRLVSVTGPTRTDASGGNLWETLFCLGDANGLPVSLRDMEEEEDGAGRESLTLTFALISRTV